jgi:hypothetical protein
MEDENLRRKILIAATGVLLLASCTQVSGKTPSAKFDQLAESEFKNFPSTQAPKPKATIIYETFDTEVPTKPVVRIPSVKPSVTVSQPRTATKLPRVHADTSPKKYALSRVGARQFACLEPLWDHESHWNYRAYNKSSGAYGIPQAVPGSKMKSAGSDWKTNPITQVKWGLHYINARYGSSCGAWSFWQSHHWY